MKKFTVEVYREIKPIKSLVDTFTSDLDLGEIVKECLVYSRVSNGSYIYTDNNVFFIIKDEKNIPFVYGSPCKSNIKWSETNWT